MIILYHDNLTNVLFKILKSDISSTGNITSYTLYFLSSRVREENNTYRSAVFFLHVMTTKTTSMTLTADITASSAMTSVLSLSVRPWLVTGFRLFSSLFRSNLEAMPCLSAMSKIQTRCVIIFRIGERVCSFVVYCYNGTNTFH